MWGLEWPPNFPKWLPRKSWCTKCFELCMFCTWPSLAVCHDIARYGLARSFMKKWNSWFLKCEDWTTYKCHQRSATKVLVHKSFELCGSCTWPSLVVWHDIARYGLVRSFMKNWNSWFLRCEVWKGLQMSLNEYHESLCAWNVWVG